MTRRNDETLERYAIRKAWELGHFWSPDNPAGRMVAQEDLSKLTIDDPEVVAALISLSKMHATKYTESSLRAYGECPQFDGRLNVPMADILDEPRCLVPDFAPPPGVYFTFADPMIQRVAERMQKNAAEAVGGGGWKSCHGVGNFHCAIGRVDDTYLPSFLKPVFLQVIKNVQAAYAEVGLLWRHVDKQMKDLLNGEELFGETVNTEISFVTSSSGWIGLAILGQNETCSSTIWAKFLATYKGGSTAEAVAQQWTTLWLHELGHNCSLDHTNGGVMNPSLVNGLPGKWTPSDPSTSKLRKLFGGVPVPIPGGNPPGPPEDPGQIDEKRIRDIEVTNAVQSATIAWCVAEIKKLKEA